MYCQNCGKEIENNATYCPVCGVKTGSAAPQQAQPQQPIINVVNTNTNANTGYGYVRKNKWVAFFLCLLLGYFGAHRFYVGKIGTAILWIFTGGMFGIGWLIDLIMILCGGFRDKAGQPLA